MAVFIYNILLALYGAVIYPVSWFNPKAKKWLEGRQDWRKKLGNLSASLKGSKVIGIHAASLGEFEQGRPVIEYVRQNYPAYKIVLTFYSPSGYEIRKGYEEVDMVCYMPMDGRRNAKDFIDLINPSLVIFIKYEFWYHYLNELSKQNIPTVLISATFRNTQPFFKWYGGFFRKMLRNFDLLFVQDGFSKTILAGIGLDKNVIVAGDTRYDRVLEIAAAAKKFPVIEEFKEEDDLLIAGSTWPDDELILKRSLHAIPKFWKLVIAPHEIGKDHLQQIKALFGEDMVLYSELLNGADGSDKKVLVIDNIGMLSSLYRYGKLAYVGGGFSKGGIHNALEPVAFDMPVIFGPVYKKFAEARELVDARYAYPIADQAEFEKILSSFVNNPRNMEEFCDGIHKFMRGNKGATLRIIKALEDHKLL